MLKNLSNIIEKHPLLIITIIIFITIGFSILIPSINIRTNFNDFAPDDEVVKATFRIGNYFSQNYQVMFLYAENQQTQSVITPEALKEQEYIQKELKKNTDIVSIIGISTLVNQICFLEFGQTFENCTDEQITIALNDILETQGTSDFKIFSTDDENEKIDYNRYPKITKGKSIDDIDIKNCYIKFNEETVTFSIEVYNLQSFEKKLKSPIPRANVVEWYIDFENIIRPDERLNVSYRISAHLEPKHPIWEIGKGILKNLKTIIGYAKEKELFNSYKIEAYLWVKPSEQDIFFPLQLKSADINFNLKNNQIEIKVSKEEIGKYGIAPRYGAFELPAKLTNFKAGTRYYQTPFFKLPWQRISINLTYLVEKIKKIREKTVISNIAEKLMKKLTNLSWQDFDKLFEMTGQYISLPDQIALKDIEKSWVKSDIAPDIGVSKNLFYYRPNFFNDLRVAAKAFLPINYDKNPLNCMVIVSINVTNDTQKSFKIIQKDLEKLDKENSFVKIQSTGEVIITSEINNITIEANTIIFPIIFIIIILVLFFSFRKISYTIISISALVISLIWVFGTMVLLGMTFNILAVAVVPLIMGLGVDYSVHTLHNYRTEISRGKTPKEAIKLSIIEIGMAMFLSMITTVIAFMSFLSASIPPLRNFGIILGLGIFYTFLTSITYVTAFRYLIDRKKKKLNNKVKKSLNSNVFMNNVAKIVLRNQKKIIFITLLITIISAIGASQIKTGFDYYSFLPAENQSILLYEKILTDFPFSSQNVEFILIEGDVATVDALNGIKKTHDNLKDDTFIAKKADGTEKTSSIYNIITQVVNSNKSLIKEFNLDEKNYIPKSNTDVKRLYDYLYNDLAYGIQTRTTIHKSENGEYDAAIVQIYVNILSEGISSKDLSKDLKTLTDEINNDVENYGKDVKSIATGTHIITYKITKSLTDSQFLSTGLCILISLIILIIVYRRISLGFVAMIPVLITTIWILGTMYFIGYNLNVLTITVTSLTIGCGIDYTIHATERFRLIADRTGNIDAAVIETISRTGMALLIAALTTALGFVVLVFAPIPPQVQFGVITALTITYAFLLSVLVLPIMLARWGKWSRKRKGYIISPAPVDEKYAKEINDLNNEH
jgi:predicted RND superfamily exporter protein